jgi:predicted nucleic acid-binding protein
MSAVIVDSNVILDIVGPESSWLAWSQDTLAVASRSARLVVNPITYAEASIRFQRAEEIDAVLPREVWFREPIPFEAAFLAGKVFMDYRRKGGTRRSPLPDFFIGAHAAVAGYTLLTRDAKRYRTYFPTVKLIAPE